MQQDDESAYVVGKNKPPRHTQWKKGQSGNQKGSSAKVRRRKSLSVDEVIREIADEKIFVPELDREI